jgi:YegS/Rv2252/BmrU family lipid kinase
LTLRRATIIYNPLSGLGRRRLSQIDHARRWLQSYQIESEWVMTQGPGHATELAAAAIAAGTDLIIVRGGDGTLNETLQAMVGSEIPLALWPRGTANVLAKVLRMPRRFEDVMRVITCGHEKQITIGQANDRYFFLMAGIGLDASIIQHLNPKLKKIGGELAFWVSGLKHLKIWKAPVFTLRVNGDEFQATFATLANAPEYGGGLRVAPEAQLDTDWLDVCALTTRSKLRYLVVHLPRGFVGHHIRHKDVIYLKAREARAESSDEVWVQVDGELVGRLPMAFRSVPRAIRVIVPSASGHSEG